MNNLLKPRFSAGVLKWAAIASMVIDHVNGMVLRPIFVGYLNAHLGEAVPWAIRALIVLNPVLDALGRIAFPIFAFQIAEGFTHTSNPRRYALRLGLFALLAEIPYDLCHFHKPLDFTLQNVLFTLLCGLLTLMALSAVSQRLAGKKGPLALAGGLTILLGMGVAFLLRGEYVFLGVLSISLFYLLRDNRALRLLGLTPLLIVAPWVLLAAPFLYLYDGRPAGGSKSFFYIFYPAHFLVLWAIACFL